VPEPLPPDLDRLGETLTKATARSVAIRQARRMLLARVGACLAAAVMVFAAASPGRLGHADVAFPPESGGVVFTSAAQGTLAVGCDRPHGAVAQRDGAPDDCAIRRPQPQAL
jgi:hypothetical protein